MSFANNIHFCIRSSEKLFATLCDGSYSMDVLRMGGEPVVVLRAGVALFFIGPVAFCIVVQVLLDAAPGIFAVDEVDEGAGVWRLDFLGHDQDF